MHNITNGFRVYKGDVSVIENLMQLLSQEGWQSKLILIGIKIALILVIGILFVKFLTKYVNRYLDKKNTQQSKTVKTVIGSIIKYSTYFFMFTAILSVLGGEAKSIFALAGVGSVAIGFGAQTFIKDVITGAFILFEEQFRVDDIVEIEGYVGRVEAIGLRTTIIRNVSNNEVYIIPNGEITTVTNKTKDFQKVHVIFKLNYTGSLDAVNELVMKTVEPYNKDERLLSKVSTSVFYDSTEPVLNVSVNCSVLNNQAYSVKNDMTNDLIQMFKEHDLEQAYPNLLNYINRK